MTAVVLRVSNAAGGAHGMSVFEARLREDLAPLDHRARPLAIRGCVLCFKGSAQSFLAILYAGPRPAQRPALAQNSFKEGCGGGLPMVSTVSCVRCRMQQWSMHGDALEKHI